MSKQVKPSDNPEAYELTVEQAKAALDAHPAELKLGGGVTQMMPRPDAMQGLVGLFTPNLGMSDDNRNFDALIYKIRSYDAEFHRQIREAGLEERLRQALKSEIVHDRLFPLSKAERIKPPARSLSAERKYLWGCCKNRSTKTVEQAAMAGEGMLKNRVRCVWCGAIWVPNPEGKGFVQLHKDTTTVTAPRATGQGFIGA